MSIAKESSSYILEQIQGVLREDNSKEIEEIIELIRKADKIFVYGVGRSALIGKAFAMRLVQLGLKVFFIGETITPIVEPEDLVLIVSSTGETMSAIQTANIARRVGAKVVAVTSKRTSKLAHAANIILHIKQERDQRQSKFAPLGTLFEVSALILLDGMAAELMDKMGESEATMRARHAIMV